VQLLFGSSKTKFMNKINVGAIGTGSMEEVFLASRADELEQYNLKKILITDKMAADMARKKYPQTEIVDSVKEIVNDPTIDLVILLGEKSNDKPLVEEVMQAGKNVRII
jgi:predicted dehydrogenase